MEFTKKQWIIGACVALVLAGGSAGIVANNQAQAQAEQTAQQAKAAHDNLIKNAKTATEQAEKFKAEADVKTAQEVIKKLNEKDQTDFKVRVETVQKNWNLVNTANKAVVSAEKSKTDVTVKTAQTAIDKLKAEMTKPNKIALQKRLDKVKADVKAKKDSVAAAKKAQADKEAQAKAEQEAQTQAQNDAQAAASGGTSVPQAENTPNYGQAAPAPETVTPAPSVPANNGGATAPNTPPAHNGGGNANPNVGLDEGNSWINDANSHPGGNPSENANGGR
jgi:hypothetical protein